MHSVCVAEIVANLVMVMFSFLLGMQFQEYLCLSEVDSKRVSDDKCKKKRPSSQFQKCNRHCKLR